MRLIKLLVTGTLLLLLTSFAYASEWVPEEPPDLEKEAATLYEKYWLTVGKSDFDLAIEIGNSFSDSSPNSEQGTIVKASIELIDKYRFKTSAELLGKFLLLERKRMYWQEYNWWPDTDLVNEALDQVWELIANYRSLLKDASNSAMRAEILYRVGLCYADNGPLGPREYDKAINIFTQIKEKHSDSDLADDDSLELIITEIKAAEDQKEREFTVGDAIERIEKFLSAYPESNRNIEAHLLLADLLEFKEEYALAEKEYLEIIDNVENSMRLEILDKLHYIYREKLKNLAKERDILERMIRQYPDSEVASYAQRRLREIEGE